MPYTEAQKKATLKYRQENYARITIDLKKEKKEEYRKRAEEKGKTLSSYIIELIEQDIAKD